MGVLRGGGRRAQRLHLAFHAPCHQGGLLALEAVVAAESADDSCHVMLGRLNLQLDRTAGRVDLDADPDRLARVDLEWRNRESQLLVLRLAVLKVELELADEGLLPIAVCLEVCNILLHLLLAERDADGAGLAGCRRVE